MQSDKIVSSQVLEFFVQRGSKDQLAAKLAQGGLPSVRFEETWPRLVGGLAFSLAAAVLKEATEETKKAITEKAPASLSLLDFSVFSDYFLAVIEEAKKWPDEKQAVVLAAAVDSIAEQVIKTYQSIKK